MLGHSSVSITLDIYGHLMRGVGHRAVKLMDGLPGEYLGRRENDYENPLTPVGKSGARLSYPGSRVSS